jgi:hypothetical protein
VVRGTGVRNLVCTEGWKILVGEDLFKQEIRAGVISPGPIDVWKTEDVLPAVSIGGHY